MIEGKAIRLRVWHDDDLPVLGSLRNDVALQAQLLARVRGSTAEQLLNWLKDRDNRILLVIADQASDAAVGFLQIADIDLVDLRGDLGICLTRDVCGRGLGGEAIALACNYLHNIWGLRKLDIRVRADNAAALRCYEKAGFKRCGLLRQHVFIDASWQDVVLMERFLTGGQI